MNDSITNKYDILSFAELREYLSDDELENAYEQESKNEQFVHLVKKIQKYEAMYGKDRTKWPKEILDEITNEKFETLE